MHRRAFRSRYEVDIVSLCDLLQIELDYRRVGYLGRGEDTQKPVVQIDFFTFDHMLPEIRSIFYLELFLQHLELGNFGSIQPASIY